MEENSFAGILKKRNLLLFQQLDEIRRRANEEWVHLLAHADGSHAGYVHLRNVERVADKMIPASAKEQFSDGEIFLLLASILLHDLGRIPNHENGIVKCAWHTISPGAPQKCKDKKRKTESQRTHACKTGRLIHEHWAIFGLPDEKFAQLCGLICFWHQFDVPPNSKSSCSPGRNSARAFSELSLNPYGHIRMPLLAGILRIADETEDSWTRALRRHWYSELDTTVRKAFRRHVTDVEFFADAECVVLHVPTEDPLAGDNDQPQYRYTRPTEIRKVLSSWGDCLGSIGIRYRYVFVSRNGIPYLEVPLKSVQAHDVDSHLQEVFSDPRMDKQESSAGTIQFPLLKQGYVKHCIECLRRLVRGTRNYPDYSWSAIEGALGEPLTEGKKWALQWIGRIHPQLEIIPNLDNHRVEIRWHEQNRS